MRWTLHSLALLVRVITSASSPALITSAHHQRSCPRDRLYRRRSRHEVDKAVCSITSN